MLSGSQLIQVACDDNSTLALDMDGNLYRCGSNAYDQLPVNTSKVIPAMVRVNNYVDDNIYHLMNYY